MGLGGFLAAGLSRCSGFDFQRAAAARFAIAVRCSAVSFLARAFPPFWGYFPFFASSREIFANFLGHIRHVGHGTKMLAPRKEELTCLHPPVNTVSCLHRARSK